MFKHTIVYWCTSDSPLCESLLLHNELRCGLAFFLEPALILIQLLFDLPFGLLAGIPISFLQQSNKDLELTGYLVHVIIGEFAPPAADLATHLFPFAFKYIFIHGSSFGSVENFVSLQPIDFMGFECL